MRRYIICSICIGVSLLFGVSLSGQKIITTNGFFYQSEVACLSCSVGELVTKTFRTNIAYLTQGFQQSNLIPLQASSDGAPEFNFSVKIFPNPASQFVTLQFVGQSYNAALSLKIFNSKGKLIKEQKVVENKTIISLSNLRPSIYLFVLYNKGIPLSSNRVLKFN